MNMGFRDLQVGQDRTVDTSLCVQLAALWARGLMWISNGEELAFTGRGVSERKLKMHQPSDYA